MKMNSDMALLDAGVKPAEWMSELMPHEMNNAGAHMNTESFVKADGSYGQIEDKTMPGARTINVDWNSVDSKLGNEVSFDSKAGV